MKKTRILLFAACAALALAVAAPLASAGFEITTAYAQSMPLAAIAFAGLAALVIAPTFEVVARHVKQALAMSLQHPGGRSPSVLLIAAKAHAERLFSRKHITVTGSWRLCPSG